MTTHRHRVDVLQPLGGWDPLLAGWPQVARALAAARTARYGATRPDRKPTQQLSASCLRPRRTVGIATMRRDAATTHHTPD